MKKLFIILFLLCLLVISCGGVVYFWLIFIPEAQTQPIELVATFSYENTRTSQPQHVTKTIATPTADKPPIETCTVIADYPGNVNLRDDDLQITGKYAHNGDVLTTTGDIITVEDSIWIGVVVDGIYFIAKEHCR